MTAASTNAAGNQAVSVALGSSPADLAGVRHSVRELLVGYPQEVVTDAVQLADELASNTYKHGAAPQAVRLVLLDGGVRLRIEVDDGSPFALPEVRGWTGSGGLGLVLVSRVAASWGVERHPGCKTVWAEIELTT